jgi:hypothetical protein
MDAPCSYLVYLKSIRRYCRKLPVEDSPSCFYEDQNISPYDMLATRSVSRQEERCRTIKAILSCQDAEDR